MQVFTMVLLALLCAAYVALLRRLQQQRQLVRTLEQDHQTLATAWNTLSPDARRLLPDNGALISIEILNPIELAAKESAIAGPVGSLAPNLIRKIVYQRTAAMLREQLLEHGVRADVKTRGLD